MTCQVFGPLSERGDTDVGEGQFELEGQSFDHTSGSPALDATPVFASANLAPSNWGRGWFSEFDQSISVIGSRELLWTDGNGARLRFFNVNASTPGTLPSYLGPMGASVTIIPTAASQGIPSSLKEKDSDGTTRLFRTFESTSILRLSQLLDRNGNPISYTRDQTGRLTLVTDVHGRFFRLTYNAAGMVESVEDSAGRSISMQYDTLNRLTDEFGPIGHTSFAYGLQNRLTQITYPNSGVKNFSYDAQGRVAREDKGGNNGRLDYAYYESSTTVTDALGRTGTFNFVQRQGLKKISSLTDASGRTTSFSYDSGFNLVATVDALGRTTRYSYDSNGNLTAVRNASGGTTLASYDSGTNKMTSLTSPRGLTTQTNYDSQGNLYRVKDALSNSAFLVHDKFGHTIQYQDTIGNSVFFTYSQGNGALASVATPLSRSAKIQTDALSHVTEFTDPEKFTTRFTYDSANDLTTISNPANHISSFGYVSGRISNLLHTTVDANNHMTVISHDEFGRVIQVEDPLSHSAHISYDLMGRPISATNRNLQQINFTYDNNDRLTQLDEPEGSINLGYDVAGNLISASNYNGAALAISRDNLNRPTQVIQTLPNGYAATIDYSYDANSNRTAMTTPWGTFKYTYDNLDRVSSIVNPYGQKIVFSYDAAGRRTRVEYPNGTLTTARFNAGGQISALIHQKSTQAPFAAMVYQYDANGNTKLVSDLRGDTSYSYDSTNRLIAVIHSTGSALGQEAFAYDPVDNRISDSALTSYIYDPANRILSNSSFSYTSDLNGNTTSRTDDSSQQSQTFTYDSLNRLTAISTISGAIATYEYDAAGNRIRRTIGTDTIRYIYDGRQILAALDASNNPIALFTNGPGLDYPLIARKNGADTFYYADAMGSVVAITDGNGNLIETVDYEAFGRPQFQDANGGRHQQSTVGNTFLFIGREYDAESGFYYLRSRYLDPQIGRFIQEDPTASINQYVYALDNPSTYKDPTGQNPLIVIGGIMLGGALVGGAASVLVAQAVNTYKGNGLLTADQAGAAFASGAVVGGIGIISAPLAGTIVIAAGLTGTLGGATFLGTLFAINYAAGAVAQGIANDIDPENQSSVAKAGFYNGLFSLIPLGTRGPNSMKQMAAFRMMSKGSTNMAIGNAIIPGSLIGAMPQLQEKESTPRRTVPDYCSGTP